MPITLNRTTIARPLSASDTMVRFASSTGLAAGHLAYIDREAMRLTLPTVEAAVWRVMRAVNGTVAAPHAVNNQIYTGPAGAFSVINPQGASSIDGAVALPHVNVLTGDVFVLSSGGSWQKIGDAGVPLQPAWASGDVASYSTAGALAIRSGNSTINSATARAMTLADPTQAQDGTVMTIFGAGGGAHTVTTPLGFNGSGGAYDVATFATTGGTLTVQVINGVWRVLSASGVTFA
jgi:hypothetical protein